MTKKQKWLVAVAAAVLVVLVVGAWFLWKGFSADPMEGNKTITFTVIGPQENREDYTIQTDADYLAEALVEKGLIEYDESGLYTTIAGITADYAADGAFWWINGNGESLMVGINDQPIANGDVYEAIYTVS